MLTITVPAMEIFVEETNEFCRTSEQTLTLEHSLIALSKWESKWHKPFLSRGERTEEETLDYIRCMTITKNVNPIVYNALTLEQIRHVEYISFAGIYNRRLCQSKFRRNQVLLDGIRVYMIVDLRKFTFGTPSELGLFLGFEALELFDYV